MDDAAQTDENTSPNDLALVRQMAKLAQLSLSDSEAQILGADLPLILRHFATLAELDTDAVAPTAHAVHLPPKLRQDVVVATEVDREKRLAGAPERLGDGFGVPQMID